MDNESVTLPRPMGKRAPRGALLAFVKEVVAHPPEACVLWPFTKDTGGYGQLRRAGRKIGAHRLAWELYHGKPMDEASHAAHAPGICTSKSCINPLHIREATPTENAADRVIEDRHNRGERQGHSKLTVEQVLAIRADSRRLQKIADDYGVCLVTISDIKHRRTWAWL